ncbi:MAG: tetratricopeptide repeat protein [Desulfovibrionaceae bacterium]|jgi:cytochrome c-type biogenesis protein CcmH/NrfG|nr:tetratricopeptide repeat protein [Desulfovibrionaceae bacterium]
MATNQTRKATAGASGTATVKRSTAVLLLVVGLAAGFYLGTVVRGLMAPQPEARVAMGPAADMPPAPQGAPEPDPELAARIAAHEKAVLDAPDDPAAWTHLGNLYFDSDQPAKAIRAYEKSLELAPGNADVLVDLGVMYRRAGQPQRAVESFQKALAANPGHEVARFNLGIVRMHDLNDIPGALAAWRELLTIDPQAKAPNGMPVRQLVEELEHSQAASAPAFGSASGPAEPPAASGGPLLPPRGQ